MGKREDVAAWLKVWYDPSVKTYSDFRKMHPDCKGYTEGDTNTYPAGFGDGSLSQKAKRYVFARMVLQTLEDW